jgi:hypothetical protein
MALRMVEPERIAIGAPSPHRFGMITPISDLGSLRKLMYSQGPSRAPENGILLPKIVGGSGSD